MMVCNTGVYRSGDTGVHTATGVHTIGDICMNILKDTSKSLVMDVLSNVIEFTVLTLLILYLAHH